eukprot:NODE_3387_length_1228_cov_125.193665_g3215_i0.p1 GENE.NODE_3387_length_1228_cov_125.193665_g3215_i0~~NODE_3387_length_1228_cov_125.193665_g3215_i0.p1  ORF type:complete len:398 (-),score=28.43 NODE_3387_length_1228_cov_125.193665_g3215_i0:35-1177(-)
MLLLLVLAVVGGVPLENRLMHAYRHETGIKRLLSVVDSFARMSTNSVACVAHADYNSSLHQPSQLCVNSSMLRSPDAIMPLSKFIQHAPYTPPPAPATLADTVYPYLSYSVFWSLCDWYPPSSLHLQPDWEGLKRLPNRSMLCWGLPRSSPSSRLLDRVLAAVSGFVFVLLCISDVPRLYTNNSKILKLFSMNVPIDNNDPKIRPLPLGLRLIPPAVPRVLNSLRYAPPSAPTRSLFIGGITLGGKGSHRRNSIRTTILKYLSRMGRYNGSAIAKIPFGEMVQAYQKYKFVLAPPGAGRDTHRLWEILLFRRVPVVVPNLRAELFTGLPMLTRSMGLYPTLTVDVLEERWLKLHAQPVNAAKTWAYWWIIAILLDCISTT